MGQEKGFRKISDEEIEEILTKLNPFDRSQYQHISDEELETMLEQHAKWLETAGAEGNQANMRLANLSNKDLKRAKLEGAKLEGAYLENTDLSFARLERAHLLSAHLEGAELSSADLSHADLSSANLYEANLLSAYMPRVNLSSATLEAVDLSFADLDGANLSSAGLPRADLSSASLSHTDLSFADLRKANLSSTDLYRANLRRSDLRNANLQGADLARAVLAETNLNYAELRAGPGPFDWEGEKEGIPQKSPGERKEKGEVAEQAEYEAAGQKNINKRPLPARNLHARQLAGADLANAGLPDHVWQGFKDGLSNVAEATKKVDKLFVGLLAGCAYFALVLALLNPGASVKLPIINTLIPQDVFFWAAPLGVLLVYLYFQLNLQRLWERLAELPAIFEDGTPLDKKASPWLPVGYVRAHFLLLREEKEKPPLSWAQTLVIQLLVWWSAPATLVAIWLRYLHDSPTLAVCLVQIVVTMAMIGAALVFLRLARRTLRLENLEWSPRTFGFEEKGINIKELFLINVASFLWNHWWRILIVAAVGAAMAWYSWHVISSAPLC